MRRVAAAIRECDWVAACSITFCGTQSAGKPYLSLEAAATAAGNILPLLGILKCGLAQGQHAARAALTSNQFLRFPPAQLRFLSAHFPNRFWKPKQAAKASVASCQSGQSCSNCRQSDWTRRRTPTQCGKFKGQCVCYAKTKHSLRFLPSLTSQHRWHSSELTLSAFSVCLPLQSLKQERGEWERRESSLSQV